MSDDAAVKISTGKRDAHLSLHRLTAYRSTTLLRVLSLVNRGVHGAQSLKALLELGGEPLVCFDLRDKKRIAAVVLGDVEDPEEGRTRWLELVGL